MTDRSEGERLAFPELNNSITSLNEQRWKAQNKVNDTLLVETKDQSDYLVRTMDSLGRAWKKIGALWVFAVGGYITGIAGIVLAVVK